MRKEVIERVYDLLKVKVYVSVVVFETNWVDKAVLALRLLGEDYD